MGSWPTILRPFSRFFEKVFKEKILSGDRRFAAETALFRRRFCDHD